MAIPGANVTLATRSASSTALEPITSQQLRKVFPESRAQDLGAPDLEQVDWGVLDYFGWIHPAGNRGYVIMPLQGELRGIKLRRLVNGSGKPRTHMCSWCHHVYRSRGTAMFSTQVAGSDGRRTIGNYICRELDCSLRIRNLSSDPPTYMPETIELKHKIWRLESAVMAFMHRANLLEDTL